MNRTVTAIMQRWVAGVSAGLLIELVSFGAAAQATGGNSINLSGAGLGTSSADTALATLRSSGTSLVLGFGATFREWVLAFSVIAFLCCALAFAFGRGKIEWTAKLIGSIIAVASVSLVLAALSGISLVLQ